MSKPALILIVEDSQDIRNVLMRLLQHNGYQVAVMSNGQEAVAYIRTQLPDLVLLDLSMPLLDGWETLKAIRALPGGGHLPVIAVTAHATASDRERVFAHGFDAYVTKPLEFRSFLETVKTALQSSS
jgi:CheY-like chemotaxis protein